MVHECDLHIFADSYCRHADLTAFGDYFLQRVRICTENRRHCVRAHHQMFAFCLALFSVSQILFFCFVCVNVMLQIRQRRQTNDKKTV